MNKMGQCFTGCLSRKPITKKQDKDVDDKRMFKVGVSVMEKDFCIQIGFSRRAVKKYNDNERPVADEGDAEVS